MSEEIFQAIIEGLAAQQTFADLVPRVTWGEIIKARETYAAELGRPAETLTKMERQTAFLNYIPPERSKTMEEQNEAQLNEKPGTPCPECGQVDSSVTGEYPCPECGMPLVWDDEPKMSVLDCHPSHYTIDDELVTNEEAAAFVRAMKLERELGLSLTHEAVIQDQAIRLVSFPTGID